MWPRRCLSGDTHVLLENGSYRLLKDIKVGDRILSWDGNGFVPDVVKNIWITEPKETIETQGYGFLPIITSLDHLFGTKLHPDGPELWKKASEIKDGYCVFNYAGIPFGAKSQPDLAELIGYMTSDGYVSAYQQPKFTNVNTAILKRVESLAYSLYGYTVIWRAKGKGYDLGMSNGTKGGGATPNAIKELFRSENQDIPKSQKRFLSCIWDFDEQSIGRFLAA